MRFISVTSKYSVFPQAPNSSESPGTSRTEHSDLLEEEEDERSDIKVLNAYQMPSVLCTVNAFFTYD